VGLSPYELYRDFSGPAKSAFVAKVRSLDEIGIDDLAILFDDSRHRQRRRRVGVGVAGIGAEQVIPNTRPASDTST
jgi:hypothetical protein